MRARPFVLTLLLSIAITSSAQAPLPVAHIPSCFPDASIKLRRVVAQTVALVSSGRADAGATFDEMLFYAMGDAVLPGSLDRIERFESDKAAANKTELD